MAGHGRDSTEQGKAMTPTQTRLKEAIRRALDSGAWERIPEAPGYVIRYKEEDIPTPAYASRGMWPGETYDRWVFLQSRVRCVG